MGKFNDDFSFEVVKDYGILGDGTWSTHLTEVSWNGREAKFDIRPWNDDMSKMGKGVSLTLEELIELHDIIERKILLEEEKIEEFSDDEDEDEEVLEDYIDDEDVEEVEFEIKHKGMQVIGQTRCLAFLILQFSEVLSYVVNKCKIRYNKKN